VPSSDVLNAQRVTPPQIAFTNLLLVGESAGQIAHANFKSSVMINHLVFVSQKIIKTCSDCIARRNYVAMFRHFGAALVFFKRL
jgi:hypothetical protein